MMVDAEELRWAILGSLVISGGITVAALSAFEGDFLFVAFGLFLFISGYRLSQRGVTSRDGPLLSSIEITFETLGFWGLVIAGWVSLSVGVTMWARTVIEPSYTASTWAGIFSIGGYTLAHIGLNRSGLGQWLLEVNQIFDTVHVPSSDSAETSLRQWLRRSVRQQTRQPNWLLFGGSITVTTVALASGAIWTCGEHCITDPILWHPEYQRILVFLLAATTWWGYLLAHYAITGQLIDSSSHGEELAGTGETSLNPIKKGIGMAVGCWILIVGMVWGMIHVQAGNHLMTYIGSLLFLGGYMIAHTVDTGKPL